MIRVICIIRPHKLEAVKSAIAAVGVSGMSVTEVRGTGNSEEKASWFGGEQQLIALPIRSRLEVVAPDELQSEIVSAIVSQAQTGEHGDGKIFVEPILDSVRVRTQERGLEAI
ncbi:MAG: P-II family nitrogen regulator [Chlorobia bacterium]|nr:P-II family nitrogen regulator [Fimbriimonadaceae bacterium]